jgi:hypothetical protein
MTIINTIRNRVFSQELLTALLQEEHQQIIDPDIHDNKT